MVEVWSKNRNIFLKSVSVVFLGIATVACGGRGTSKTAQTATQTAISEVGASNYQVIVFSDSLTLDGSDTIDLGRIGSGEVLEKIFMIRNSTTKPLVINDISTDCGCTTVDYPQKPLEVGESVAVKLKYNSGGQQGWQFKALRVVTSQGDDPRKIYLTAEIK